MNKKRGLAGMVAANAFTWFGRILYQISSCMEELQASEWHFCYMTKDLKNVMLRIPMAVKDFG